MSWYLGKAIIWSRGGMEGQNKISKVCMLSTFLDQKKSDPCKGNFVSSDHGILYPAPKIKNPNLNFKLRCREIIPLAHRNFSFLTPTLIILGIEDSRRFFLGIPLCFSSLGFTILLILWGTTWMVKWWNSETKISPLGFTMLLLSYWTTSITKTIWLR